MTLELRVSHTFIHEINKGVCVLLKEYVVNISLPISIAYPYRAWDQAVTLDSPVLTVLCSFPLLCFMDCSFRSADTKPNNWLQQVPFLLLLS